MTEQVIDIRDRIEKMRNQMTPNSDNTIKKKDLKTKNAIFDSKSTISEKNKLVGNLNKTQKKSEIIEEVDFTPSKLIQENSKKQNNLNEERTDILESHKESQQNRKENFRKKDNFKTYDDYQNENVVNEKKQTVNIDENQPFPQFSLNVSNPISWKLMLLIMLMQLLTNMMLVVVLYLK